MNKHYSDTQELQLRRELARPLPAILPVGWTVTPFPGFVEIRDHTGTLIHAVGTGGLPWGRTLGSFMVQAMNEIHAGKSIVGIKIQ